jgi:hypothetical protein
MCEMGHGYLRFVESDIVEQETRSPAILFRLD